MTNVFHGGASVEKATLYTDTEYNIIFGLRASHSASVRSFNKSFGTDGKGESLERHEFTPIEDKLKKTLQLLLDLKLRVRCFLVDPTGIHADG